MIPVYPEGQTPRFSSPEALLPAIAQDKATGAVLMLAWMNQEAFEKTRTSGRATYFSRSRKEIWEKGATSGHTLHVEEIRIDCDQDAILLKVRPDGPACHTGKGTCWAESNETALHAQTEAHPERETGFLKQLQSIVTQRIADGEEDSYTAKLARLGAKAMAQKIGEEGVEVALEAMTGDDKRLLEESADLMYHLLVLLVSRGKGIEDVEAILRARHHQE